MHAVASAEPGTPSEARQADRYRHPIGSGCAECQSDVVPAETKGILDGVAVIAAGALAGHEIQIDLGVEVFQVEGGRYDAVAHHTCGDLRKCVTPIFGIQGRVDHTGLTHIGCTEGII